MNAQKPVLYIEDDEIDVINMEEAFAELRIANPLKLAGNGVEGLAYLRDEQREKPCVILLDLNMPKMGGIEFLREVKSDPILRRLPVVVLTTSQEESDKIESYDLGVAGYMVKPVGDSKFKEVIKTIEMYWTLSETP